MIPDPENTLDDVEDVGLDPDDSVFEDFAQALEQLAPAYRCLTR